MKAIVVGGGIIGSAIARRLQDANWEVVVVNHGTLAPATEIAAGILLPDSQTSCQGVLGEWNSDALRAWRDWYDVSEKRGAFLFSRGDEEKNNVYQEWLEDHGLDTFQMGARDTDLPISDQVAKESGAVLHVPEARTVVTENLVRDLRGPLNIVYEKATELVLLHGRARGVRTKGSLLSGDLVIAACGWSDWSWSPVRPKLLPWQGERVLFDGYPHEIPLIGTGEGGLISRGGGRLWAGVSFRKDDSGQPQALAVADIINRALRWLPDLQQASILSVGAGIRPGTDDGLPLLGETEIPGLYLATGHGRSGILGAPLSAEIILQTVQGHSSLWSERVATDRFSPSPS